MSHIILASKSPRRRELMALITPDFVCETSEVDEHGVTAPTAPALCLALADLKCRDIASHHPGDTVIGCDTVVDVDGSVLGKPVDPDDARRMLRTLAGRTHLVHTGVSILAPGGERRFVCTTGVRFFPLTDAEIEAYIATPEPYDKAGGYGVQGAACRFLDALDGDYFNVMGFPVSRIYRALRELSVL